MSSRLRCKVKLNLNSMTPDNIKAHAVESAWKTMEYLHTDVVQSQTIPRDSGHMQNFGTHVPKEYNMQNDIVAFNLRTDTPYARRLYFGDKLNFNKEKNPNAGAYWFKTYARGEKKDMISEVFVQFFNLR